MSEFGYGKDTALSTMGRADLDAMGGTLFASVYHAEPFDFFPLDDVEAFVDGLRYFHQFSYGRKEANGLISPSIFDPTLSDETSRGSGEHPCGVGHLAGQRWRRPYSPGIRSTVPTAPHGDLQQLQQYGGEATMEGVHPDHGGYAYCCLQGHR